MARARFGFELNRRDFLKLTPLAAAAGALYLSNRSSHHAGDFAVPDRSSVSLLPASSYDVDLADVVSRGFKDLRVDVRGRRVLLKPNLVEYEPGTMINTNPAVVGAVGLACLRAGAREVVVAEGPGHRRDIEYLLSATGMLDHLNDLKLPFVDLNHDDVRRVALKTRFTGLNELFLPASLVDADFVISMPKLKTHHWAGMTASMKNLFGTVPGAIYGWPKNVLHVHGIENSILDLASTIRPHLAVVDAITGMEGDGPIMGKPRQVGVLVMGTDLPAVDATCARLIGLDPRRMAYIARAGEFLGNIDERRIEQRGERLDQYRTDFDLIESFKMLRLGSNHA